MAVSESEVVQRHGAYLDLGGLWVRYDAIGTIKQINGADGAPYCQVVLTLPGYKTLGVGCTAGELMAAVQACMSNTEWRVGVQRARGMRGEGSPDVVGR